MGWGAAAAAAASAIGGIASASISSGAAKDAASTQAQASRDATAQTLQAAQQAIQTMQGFGGQALGVLAPFFSGRGGAGPMALGGLNTLATNPPPGTDAAGFFPPGGAPGASASGSAAGAPTAAQLQAVATARPDLFSAFQKSGQSDFASWLQNWYGEESPGGINASTKDGDITAYNKSTSTPSFGGFVNSVAASSAAPQPYTVPTAPSEVASVYQNYLGRAPTAAEMNQWNVQAELGNSPAAILSKVQSSITSSPEYQADQQAGKVGSDGTFYQAPGMADLSALSKGSASSPVVSNLHSLADLSSGAYAPLKGILAGTDPSQQNLTAFANGTAPGQSTLRDIVQGTSPALATEQAVFSGNAPTLQPLSALANGRSGLTAGLLPAQIAGSAASGKLMDYLTNPGSYQASPAFQFERDQGLNAITNAASATGAGGNTQEAAAKFAEGLAGQDYFNTLTSLQSLAGLGVNAAGTSAGVGAGAATSLGGIGQSAAANLTGAQTGSATDLLANEAAAATARANIGASSAGQLTSSAVGAQGDLASIIANAMSQLYGGSLSSSQSAAALLGNLGSSIGSTAVGAGNNISSNIIGAGNAAAAGQIGSANALAGGINGATSGIGNNLLLLSLLGKGGAAAGGGGSIGVGGGPFG